MAKFGWKGSGIVMFRWPVRRAKLLGSVMAALLAAAAWAQFTTDVRLVRIVATVKTRTGQLVGGLQKEDFLVSDNGAPQEVKIFERQTDQPLSVALMIDTSGSTAKDLKFETDSAAKFVRALLGEGNPKDSVSLWGFDYDVHQETNFTHRMDFLESRLKTIHGSAGTSLYDAIWFAAHELEPRDGRKVMVIVTDGGNTTSYRNSQQALEAAQLADAVAYPVVVIPIMNEAGRNTAGENFLTFLADGTGGRTFLPSLGSQLDKAFRDIISDLRTEYLLGYYPRNVPLTKNRFHTLQVRVKAPELQVFARNGYYGEAEASIGTVPDARMALEPVRRGER
jgi:Ca-activated chloride channel family protein